MQDTSQFIMMPIPASQYTAVCALLGGTLARIAADTPPTHEPTPAPIDAAHPPAAASTEQLEAVDQSPPVNDAEIDSAGVSFDEAIHTGTKRMRPSKPNQNRANGPKRISPSFATKRRRSSAIPARSRT